MRMLNYIQIKESLVLWESFLIDELYQDHLGTLTLHKHPLIPFLGHHPG